MPRFLFVFGALIFGLAACGPSAAPMPAGPPPGSDTRTSVADAADEAAGNTAAGPNRSEAGSAPAADAIPAPATPPGPPEPPRRVRASVRGIDIDAVVFDARTHHLIVADQPDGPGSRWPDARAAADALGGLAAVNGGFFTPEGAPLGLVVRDSRRTGALRRGGSLGSGLFVESAGGRLALVRRESFSGARHALQSGPFLVEDGRAVDGLGERSAARTFVATDGRGRWMIARAGRCTLRQLAAALAAGPVGGLTPDRALNLDGGRSADLWIGESVRGGPHRERPFWNKPVRNFLVLRARR